MADEDIQYASVVFKNKKQPQPKSPNKEETIYAEVKMQNETPQESSDSKVNWIFYSLFNYCCLVKINNFIQQENLSHSVLLPGLLSEKEAERRRRYYQKLSCCLGTFCIILVLGIIGITVYNVWYHQKELNELKESGAKNKNLTDQINNLTQVSESKIHNLRIEKQELKEKNHNLTKQIQDLEGENRNLKEQIDNMTKTQNELNVSQAQWSIDEYCRKDNRRRCEPCQKGWQPFNSKCYVYNNAKGSNQKNWDEAQQDCKRKVSHLSVVDSQKEKVHLKTISPAEPGIDGYWIGLRAEGSKWKWIDGAELANQDWIKTAAVDGQCVTCLKKEWKSVSC
ncbi:C-type lectin domain family 12 member B-like [Xiphophorus couchianus]|uniref:C-type lectin domain family 12 member B-like n=1 Tax=Xiphophorus couchianus TaxID=32473 RepID=UPI0010167534|nr:C-type lectin domain family 12 member B-like [Xiphophorus couchianus]